MKTRIASVLIALCPFLIAGCHTTQPPSEMKLENLMQRTLAEDFTPGREVIVSYVEIPPNTTMERHWHPGEEFHYYLEGEVEIAIDGRPSIIGTPGTVGPRAVRRDAHGDHGRGRREGRRVPRSHGG